MERDEQPAGQDEERSWHAAAMAERRNTPRSSVIKSAKLIFDNARSVFDCLVLDESATGILVDLGMVMKIPREMTIQFGNGARYPALLRWSAGTKAGLKFSGAQIIEQATARRLHTLAELLRTQGLGAAMASLRAVRFFDNAGLRRAAEEAEAAQVRFEAMLEGRSVL